MKNKMASFAHFFEELRFFRNCFTIHTSFFPFGILIAAATLLISHTSFSYDFYLEQNSILDKLYIVLDPLFLNIITGIITFNLFAQNYLSNYNFPYFERILNYGSKLIIAMGALVLLSLMIIVTVIFLEQRFHLDPPHKQIEYRIINDYLENPNAENQVKLIHTDFNSPVGTYIRNNYQLNSKSSVIYNLRDSLNLYFPEEYNWIRSKQSLYPNESFSVSLRQILAKNKHFESKSVPWFQRLINIRKETMSDLGISCPSGNLMLQSVLFIITIFFISQIDRLDHSKKLNETRSAYYSVLVLNFVSMIFILFSQIYDFSHSLRDLTFSMFSAIIFILVITYRRQLKMRKFYEGLLESIPPIVIVVVSSNGKVSYVNMVVEEILGYTVKEISRENFLEMLFESEGYNEFIRQLKVHIKNPKREPIELNITLHHKHTREKKHFIVKSSLYRSKLVTSLYEVLNFIIKAFGVNHKIFPTTNSITFIMEEITKKGIIEKTNKLLQENFTNEAQIHEVILKSAVEMGFKRARLYKYQNRCFYGLKAIGMESLEEKHGYSFENFQVSIEEAAYNHDVFKENQPQVFSVERLKPIGKKLEMRVLEQLGLSDTTWIDIPFKIGNEDETFYYLSVDKGQDSNLDLSMHELTNLNLYSKNITLNLQNAELYSIMDKNQVREREFQSTILTLLNERSEKKLFEVFIETLSKSSIEPDYCSISVYSSSTKKLIVKASKPSIKFPELSVENGRGISVKAFNTKKTVICDDCENDSDYLPLEEISNVSSEIAYPIFYDSDVIGIINCSSSSKKFSYTNNELESLLSELDEFAHKISPVIKNLTMSIEGNLTDTANLIHQINHSITIPLNLALDKLKEEDFDKEEFESAIRAIQIITSMMTNEVFSDIDHDLELLETSEQFERLLSPLYYVFVLDAKRIGLQIKFNYPDVFTPLKLIPSKIILALALLLDNAVNYSKPRKGSKANLEIFNELAVGDINITIATNENELSIQVCNYGIEFEHDSIDGVSSRGDKAKIIRPKGKGIGLETAKKIVTSHGGTITLIQKVNPTIIEMKFVTKE